MKELKMNKLSLFEDELKSKETKYFIFDSNKKEVNKNNLEFSKHGWDTSKFNKVRPGDLFLYRRPLKTSELKKFYFFGAGKIEAINKCDGSNVIGIIVKPLKFDKFILQTDVENFRWEFKERNNNWKNFFNQGGITQITKSDFERIIEIL